MPISENIEDLEGLTGHKYHLITKYYETDILFCPVTDEIEKFPTNLMDRVGGVLIYFNATNREFLQSLPKYAEFLSSNQIEMGILLCHQLIDDPKLGITYKEAKKHSTLLDVIELGRVRDEDADEDDPHDPIGYDELLQALKSFIWSNIEINGIARVPHGYGSLLDDDEIDEETFGANLDEEEVERELAGFEKLLSEVMQFRDTFAAGGLNRNERLLHAQGFADMFDDMIGDGDSESSSGVDK